jgi:hypothetical protein
MKYSLLLITFKVLALHSLDTLDALSIPNPSLLCLVLLLSVVNNFQLIISFTFNYLAVIVVCIAFESSVINLT